MTLGSPPITHRSPTHAHTLDSHPELPPVCTEPLCELEWFFSPLDGQVRIRSHFWNPQACGHLAWQADYIFVWRKRHLLFYVDTSQCQGSELGKQNMGWISIHTFPWGQLPCAMCRLHNCTGARNYWNLPVKSCRMLR